MEKTIKTITILLATLSVVNSACADVSAEAKRMAQQSPGLVQSCQLVQFASPGSSLYAAIRKEPEAHCLSTLEACAQALVLLEEAHDAAKYLGSALRLMIERREELRSQRQGEPRQKGKQLYERNRRRRQVEKSIFDNRE